MASNKTNRGNLSSADFDLVNQRLDMDSNAQMKTDLAKRYSGNFQERSIEQMDENYENQTLRKIEKEQGMQAAQDYAKTLSKVKDVSSGKKYPSSMADFLEGAQLRKHNRDESKYSRQLANGTPDSQAVNDVDRSAENERYSQNNEANYYERQESGAKESNSFMDDIGDDADAWLAANGGAVPTSEPKDIYGNNDYEISDLTETEADLLTGGNASREARLFDGIGSENDTGGASSMHIQLERFTNMSLPQVKYAYDLLSDPTLTGHGSTRTEFNGDVRGVTAKSAVEAAEAFNVTVHGRGEEFRHELGLFIDRADMGASEAGRTMPSRGAQDQMMMQNMLGVTAEAKEEAGPGSALYGVNMNPESQIRANDDLAWLTGKLDDYAVMYNRDDTRMNAPDLYAKRLDATKQALSSWLQEKHPGQRMVDSATGLYMRVDDPSKTREDQDYVYESTAVPLPADLGIRGLKMTANKRDGFGSPHNRLSYSKLFPTEAELMESGTYNTQVWHESEAAQYSEEDRMRLAPSIKRTFFDKSELGGKEAVDEAYDVMRKDFKKMAKIMQRETATTQDENYGNNSRYGSMGQTDEEYARQEAINMSKVFDLDQTNEEISVAAANESGFGDMTSANLGTITGKGLIHKSGRTPEEQIAFKAYEDELMLIDSENAKRAQRGEEAIPRPINPTDEYSRDADYQLVQNQKLRIEKYGTVALSLTGEDRQGMHGAEGSSQSDHFVNLMTDGMSADDAYEEVVHGLNKGAYRSKLVDEEAAIAEANPAPSTDQELYLARQKLRLESGEIHEQRTPGWFKQREGLVTGSGVKGLLSPKGKDNLVGKMVGEATGTGKKFVPNFYTSEGTKYEETVQKMFEERTGLKVEEAYFETNEEYAGFGASPDGIVFDKKGNAHGVAEFKMHNSVKAMKKSYNDYYNQVQMQMAITDTKEAHFFRINSETDDYMYDVVERDQDHIDKLMKVGTKVLKDVDYITNNTEEADMGRNLSIEEVNDLIQDSKEDFAGYVPAQDEVKKAKKHKAYGSKPKVVVPVKPKDPAGSLSAHVRAFEMESRKIDTASYDSGAFDKQKFDTKMAKEVTRMKKEDAAMLKTERDNEKKLHDKKMKNEQKYSNLRTKNIAETASMLKSITNQFVAFNRGAGEDAMSIANSAATLGMDSNRAAGQSDLVSEAGNMTFEAAQKVVFAGAQQQNSATAGGGQLRGFMDRQKAAAVTAARGGYSYQVYGPAEMESMNPGSYLGSVMSKIDGMDKQTQAKVLGELGLGSAAPLIGRTTGEAIQNARHGEYVEDELRDKDKVIRRAAGVARDIGYSALRNTSDEGLKLTEAVSHVLDNPMGMGFGMVGKLKEVLDSSNSSGGLLGVRVDTNSNDPAAPSKGLIGDLGDSSAAPFKRSGSPFGRLSSTDASSSKGASFGSLSSTSKDSAFSKLGIINPTDDSDVTLGRITDAVTSNGSSSSFNNTTPNDSIQEAMTFRTSDNVAPKGSTTVNSNLKVEITENDINTSLTDDFGNTSVSTQPRNGGM